MPPRRRPRAHNGGANPPPSSVPRVCRLYNEGSCRYGEKCKFLHNAAQGFQSNAPLVAAAAGTNGTTLLAHSPDRPAETHGHASVEPPNVEPAVEEQNAREHTARVRLPQSAGQIPHRQQVDDVEAIHQAGDGTTVTGARGGRSPLPTYSPPVLPTRKPCFAFQKKGWCKKGNACRFGHDLNTLQSGINLQNIARQARLRAEQAQEAARERERQAQEEERFERERLEWERLESERLERERAECERLEAERLERQRAEAERIASERVAAAARRAEERARQQREKAEKLLREQEAKRRQEAKVTLQFVVQGSNLVTFGPGLEVKRVVPGFDLCKVTIRNLPTDATEKEVANIFKEQGLDDTMFKLLELRPERGTKSAKILTRNEEAGAMAVGLESLEFRDKILAFEVEENTAWGSMKSSAEGTTDANTLTFFWNAPSVVMIATYATVEEARRKARELNRRQFGYGDRTITAILNPRPNGPASRYWVEASVKIANLGPGTMPEDVEAIAGTPNVRPIKSNNYDPTTFLAQLKLYLRLDGCIADSFQSTELQTGTGRMKGTARFPSRETLRRAADRLGAGAHNWPKIRVAEQHQYSITILMAQYHAQRAQWDSMTETARGKKAFVRINERRNGHVFVNVEGSEEKEVGELKVRVESLVAGERLGAEHWHSTYASHLGKALFDRVKNETTVLVTVDRRFQALRLFGAGNAVAEAKTLIGQDVERLKLTEFTISVERQSVRFFVATGLPILKEALGEDNVSLDVSSRQCSLKLRGGDDAIKHAQKLVEEAVTAARAGLQIPTQGDANEGPPCPICYDTPSHPEVLSCGHSCCEPCLRHYIASAATSDTFPLVCMGNEATCNAPISVPIIHRYLTQQRFTMLVDAVFASYIQSNSRRFKYCTTPDCTQIYQCDTDRQFHQCPACFSRICSSCNEEAHEGMTCEERRIQSDPGEQDRLNNEWAQTNNVKRCPTCDVMTEKTEGCNHMTCRCGVHWCWICRGVFDARTIYTHMQDSHGGIYGGAEPVPNPAAVALDAQVRRNREAAQRLLEQREQERRTRERNATNDDWMQGLNIKQCPGCNILTEKAGGYDHMTCRCGTHWCWECRGVFEAATIFAHLRNAHGGIGLGQRAPAAAANVQPRVPAYDFGGFYQHLRAGEELAEAERVRRERLQREQTQQRLLADMQAARRTREREIAEQAAAMRRNAEKKDSWCAIM